MTELERVAFALLAEVDGAPDMRRPASSAVAFSATPPRLTRSQLAKIVASSPKVQCECPHHIAELVYKLLAFEEYSASCESSSPEDASLHRELWQITAHARALYESALVRVAEAEGLSLDC